MATKRRGIDPTNARLDYGLDPLIRLDAPLPFQEDDFNKYPWLKANDRYYYLASKLGHGGFSIAYKGWACDKDGTRWPTSEDLVLKIPNIDQRRSSSDIENRTISIQKKTIDEWAHVRKRLSGCQHANPIFDMGMLWVREPSSLLQLAVTAQPFLANALPLKDWLVEHRLRPKIVSGPAGGEIGDWSGIAEWQDWLLLATTIAVGLCEIHRRRVIHGDIWPPNIYISKNEPRHVIFIDFGESFISTPSGEPRTQPDHPYRAPERDKSEYVPTEQVDVYSFGKLLLYLTTGRDIPIPREVSAKPLIGHRRRTYVRDELFKGTTGLIDRYPEILDVISQCTAWDPVDRPDMAEILTQLRRLQNRVGAAPVSQSVRRTRIVDSLKTSGFDRTGVLSRFVDRKIDELDQLIDSCATEMVEVRGTRDLLIDSLVALFDEMNKGDSWTTLTAPSVWRHECLGLDGRYTSATIEAIRRGATVQRTYAISVEELGIEWAEAFAMRLKGELKTSPELGALHHAFQLANDEFKYYATRDDHKARPMEVLGSHSEHFVTVMESLDHLVELWKLKPALFEKAASEIRSTTGLYLGLVIVSTVGKVRELRIKNPVSLMCLNRETKEEDKWLLVMTDIRGRNEYDSGGESWPQLRGIRIYRSVMTYPKDRVLGLEDVLKLSINVGPILTPITKLLREPSSPC